MLRYFCFLLAFLCCPLAYCQQFEEKLVTDLYTDLSWTQNLKFGQAILLYTVQPAGTLGNAKLITYNDLKTKNIDFTRYKSGNYYGNYYSTGAVENSSRYYISLVDSKYFYVTQLNPQIGRILLPALQEQMSTKHLGTIAERARYIRFQESMFLVEPVDFTSFLSRWILAGIGLFISIPLLYLVFRFVRGTR